MTRRIDHIGILVDDLEAAVERWSRATGHTFSAVGRYRTSRYVDSSAPSPHPHDARFVISRGGAPRVELLEATGPGTHSRDHLGAHHLAVTGVPDLEAQRAASVAVGLRIDGENTDDEGRLLLYFTDPTQLDGLRLEFVSALPGPITTDSGALAPVDPVTGRPSILMIASEEDPA